MSDEQNPSTSDESTPEPSENSLRAFETVWRFLEEDGWHPTRVDDKYIYRMQFSGQNGQQNVYAIVRVDMEQLLLYAVAPVKAAEPVRGAVSEFLTRANYGLRIGNFEMDYSDGEVRYKSSLDFEHTELQSPMVRNALYPAVQTLDRYMPGLMRVMYGGLTPVEAILEIETDDSDG
jgi:hypothetical protein